MKSYSYSDYLKKNRMKYYFLIVPVVVLLAAAVYIFFIYDPNPSKNSNNGVSMNQGEPEQIEDSPEIETATVTDAVEFTIAPVTLPSAEESSNEVSSNEDDQVGVAASEEESSRKIAISDEAESMGDFVSAANEGTVKKTTKETAEEPTTTVAVDDPIEIPITSAAFDDSIEETAAAAEQPIEDSSTTGDATAKRVTYVETGSIDSPQGVSPAEDYGRETVAQVEEKQSHSIEADDQQKFSGGYIEYKAVIASSLSQATSDAGLSANQSARIGRIFKPYLDSNRELRKGDKLMIFLDPGVAKTGNDADRIERLEFHGARKTLVVTRKAGSLSDYEVRNADGEMLTGEVSTAPITVEKPRREVSVEPAPAIAEPRREASVKPAPRSAADYKAATGNMKRLEGVVTVTLFSAAREAGLDAGQLKKLEEIMNPYINFNKEVRKGDRIVIMLDGSEIYSSEFNGVVKQLTVARGDDGVYRMVKPGEAGSNAQDSDNSGARKPPFWKRWWSNIGASNEEKGRTE